ncbi:MAG TPA: GNAT family N-acetyltransferase [Nocardioidaceae bacterium]|nr:GNAT family N-acetyltransferase [Nocardioidaceae bacterium]
MAATTWAGDVVELRPLWPGESAPLLAVFAGMSLTSRAGRYLVGIPSLPRSMLDALTAVDGYDHVAWLASVRRQPAGIARYIRAEPGRAELAFEVADDYQGRGVGTALLDAVTTVACTHGVRRVSATVLASNTPSRRLLGRVGVRLPHGDGVLEGEGRLRLLDPPRVDRAAVLALARARSATAAGVLRA